MGESGRSFAVHKRVVASACLIGASVVGEGVAYAYFATYGDVATLVAFVATILGSLLIGAAFKQTWMAVAASILICLVVTQLNLIFLWWLRVLALNNFDSDMFGYFGALYQFIAEVATVATAIIALVLVARRPRRTAESKGGGS